MQPGEGVVRRVGEHRPVVGHPLLVVHHFVERRRERRRESARQSQARAEVAAAVPAPAFVRRPHAEGRRGHDQRPRVADKVEPDCLLRRLPERRPAPGAAHAVHAPEVAHRAGDRAAPVVVEARARVQLHQSRGGKPARGPVLLGGEKRERLPKETRWHELKQGEFVFHLDVVHEAHKAEVVQLEPGARRPEEQVVSQLALEPGQLGAKRLAAERRAGGVVPGLVVGTLEIVHAVLLRERDRRPAPLDMVEAEIGHRAPAVVPQVGVSLEDRRRRRPPKIGFRRGVELATDVGDLGAELGAAAVQFAQRANDEIIGLRLDRRRGAADHPFGDRVDHADGDAIREPAGELGGAGDMGECGIVRRRPELRRAADAARVEDPLAGAAAAIQAGSLLEERPALIEPDLECRQVEHRGIGLHLSEIRVHGGVEGEVRREPGLHVEPDGGPAHAAVAGGRRLGDVLRHRVGQQLEVPRRSDAGNAAERAELRDERIDRCPVHRPRVALVEACDVPPDAEAEFVRRFRIEPELAERHAKLGGPAEFVDPRRRVPHAVPRHVLDHIGVDRGVALHSGRVHHQFHRRAPVVIGVDHDLDLVRRGLHVATAEEPGDAVGMRVERPYEDVQVVIVVRRPNLGCERRVEVLPGLELAKAGHRRRELPHVVVGAPVDHRRPCRANRHAGAGWWQRRGTGRRAGRRLLRGELEREQPRGNENTNSGEHGCSGARRG